MAPRLGGRTGGLVLLLLLSLILQGTLVSDGEMSTALDEGVSSEGGSSILIDEYTATWCQICDLVDPLIPKLLEPNGERVAYVANHPDDGVDTLGNSASTTRIEWMLGEPVGTPTFIFDGEERFTGLVTLSELHADLLAAESVRSRSSELELSAIRDGATLILELTLGGELSQGEMLSILITEDGVNSFGPDDEAMDFDHVLRAMVSVELSEDDTSFVLAASDDTQAAWNASTSTAGTTLRATMNISGDWDLDSLGFVGVHEAHGSAGHSVLGAVQVVVRSSSDSDDGYAMIWMLAAGTVLIGGIALSAGVLSQKPPRIENSDE